VNDRSTRFEALFKEVYEPLQRYAVRRTDRSTADDVVADALLVLWRRLDDVPEDLVLAWCYGVARRCLANNRRGAARQAGVVDRLTCEPNAAVDVDGTDDGHLEAALATLESDDREIVRLWAWELLPPREIAVVLGITPNAASIRLHRAKGRLAAAMGGKNGRLSGHIVVGNTPAEHDKEAM
jgi:RNA polymerase sigma-70 factor (ECF subfamily)